MVMIKNYKWNNSRIFTELVTFHIKDQVPALFFNGHTNGVEAFLKITKF